MALDHVLALDLAAFDYVMRRIHLLLLLIQVFAILVLGDPEAAVVVLGLNVQLATWALHFGLFMHRRVIFLAIDSFFLRRDALGHVGGNFTVVNHRLLVVGALGQLGHIEVRVLCCIV